MARALLSNYCPSPGATREGGGSLPGKNSSGFSNAFVGQLLTLARERSQPNPLPKRQS
jgi:hypothetical protein